MTNPPIVALLVGIDRYASDDVTNLSGCVNDVTAMRQLLIDLYGVDPGSILTLVDEAATRDAILEAFRSHLIVSAAAIAADDIGASQALPPAYLFHYSGHGSQAIDPTHTEPDGMDETVVPHDSRLPDQFDIKDWEIGALLDELARYSDNVTVILDSCHSGSGTRAARAVSVGVRRCPPDLREQPGGRPASGQTNGEGSNLNRTSPTRTTARGLTSPSDWLDAAGSGYVLLAGCRDQQESSEMDTEQGAHGAFTHHLIRALSQSGRSRARGLTYAELHERVRHDVNHLFRDQDPQCEGDCGRFVFGGAAAQRGLFFSIVERAGGYFWLDAGLAHGVLPGSVFAVFPPDTLTLEDAGEPIAVLEAVEVGAVRSGCTARAVDGEAPVAIPLHARAAIRRLSDGSNRRTVRVDIADGPVATAIRAEIEGAAAAPYLQLVEDGIPAFRIASGQKGIEIQDGSGARLVPHYDFEDREATAGGESTPRSLDNASVDSLARSVVGDLATMVRFESVRTIRNQNAGTLAGRVKVSFRHVDFDHETQQVKAGEPWSRFEDGAPIIEEGERIMLHVEHDHAEPLFVAVFDLDANFAVTPLYPPSGAHEALSPGQPITLGLSQVIRASVPSIRGSEAPSEVRQTIKVIASRDDADFRKLTLPGLGDEFVPRKEDVVRSGAGPSALTRLLVQTLNGGRLRLSVDPPSVGDEWTTAELEYITVGKAEDRDARLTGGQPVALPFHAIEVLPPDGFEGRIRVLDPRQATRADGGDSIDLQPPPGLAAYQDLEQLALSPRRSTERDGAVIELEADDEARRMISPERPLRFRLGRDATEPTVAFAYDGTFHYPVGRSGPNGTLDLTWLPDPEDTPLRSTRDLRRTVKLYLYKLAGRSDPFLGLHHARFVPRDRRDTAPVRPDERALTLGSGEVRYREVKSNDFEAGQRVALLVHGFNSDTRGIVSQLSTVFGDRSPYNHLLSWDYESFATHVENNGADLANALRRAGLDRAGIYLDIYAHSMGTLVTRCLVEKFGGAPFVDKVLLAGPPNEGTQLAAMKRYVTFLLTVAINQAAPIAPTLIASWILGKVSDDAVGAADLDPSSKILAELNGGDGALHGRYHVLAGDYEETTERSAAWRRMAAKVSDSAADIFFDDDNDLVINVSSMRGSGRFRPDPERVKTVACDHFGYFSAPDSVAHMLTWMR